MGRIEWWVVVAGRCGGLMVHYTLKNTLQTLSGSNQINYSEYWRSLSMSSQWFSQVRVTLAVDCRLDYNNNNNKKTNVTEMVYLG